MHGRNPNGSITELFGEQVNSFEVIDIDLTGQGSLIKASSKFDLVELAHEVVLDPKLLEHVGAASLREDDSIKQVGETFVGDEIPLDGHLGDLTGRVSQDTFSDALQAGKTDPIVSQIEELQARVGLQRCSEGACSINIKDIAVEG